MKCEKAHPETRYSTPVVPDWREAIRDDGPFSEPIQSLVIKSQVHFINAIFSDKPGPMRLSRTVPARR
jgi:hypothetical protein